MKTYHSGITRRDFVRRTLTAAGAAATAGNSALMLSDSAKLTAAEPKEKPVTDPNAFLIVDTHQHLWDVSKFTLAWHKEAPKLAKSHVMSDYFAATRGLNVTKTVYMEVDVDPGQQVKEAEYVLDLCQRDDNPMVAAVISGRPADHDTFKNYISKYKDTPQIKGVRQVLHGDGTPAGFCLAPTFVKSVQLLGDLGKSFDLCMRSGELLDGEKLVAQCPKTRFIVDHCGNMSVQDLDEKHRAVWMTGMKALAQRSNVICKISGIIASAKPDSWKPADLEPNIRFTLETFGIDRCIFASDWPVCTLTAPLKDWVDALKSIVRDRSSADQRKLFHDNAVKFYGLKNKAWKAKT
ncbi:MAG: amidohydrolase family protein [Planctomycetales bacterium]|nr:amidohydrolase family protein [Planctomycetales bacterium]